MPSDLIGVADPVAPTSKDELIPATFKLVEGHAAGAIAWYWEAKQWPKRLSKGIRFLALLLFGLGALPPFLHAIGVRPPVADGPAASWTAWGYLALALGTSALAFDHFFGLSSAYTRYVTTAMSLERARYEFRLDWLGLMAKFGSPSQAGTPAEPFIARAIVFLKAVLDLTDRETQDWVAEFRTNLSELERIGKAQHATVQPGTLDVVVTGAVTETEEVVVSVDNVERARLKGPGTVPIGPVLPGTHLVTARNAATGAQGVGTTHVTTASNTSLSVTVPAAR